MDIHEIEKTNVEFKTPRFKIGDTVKVYYKIVEGAKERVQTFEGILIAFKNQGISRTFKVRKISYSVGVERTFPLYSPRIQKVEVTHHGRVRRAKLYFLRDVKGSKATHFKRDNRKFAAYRELLELDKAAAAEEKVKAEEAARMAAEAAAKEKAEAEKKAVEEAAVKAAEDKAEQEKVSAEAEKEAPAEENKVSESKEEAKG